MSDELMFSADELRVDEGLGYPKAYAKICRDRGFGPYGHGPPFTYTPYVLQSIQASRAKELDELFPVIDPKARPTAKPKMFVSLLWKQLNHLGNAGFDPEAFRVDPYGNVLYFHADSASPLYWDIDHWFPCSRGGLTVSSNLRLLQWQVCKKKYNKLEFLVPWWDLQVGISVNQFLSIFASSNSDFRHRGFYLLFSNGENEELNDSQTVESHCFPQPFNESKKISGLAPAAIVVSRKESNDTLLALQSVDINRRHTINSPIAANKLRPSMLKENEKPDMAMNPYQAIVIARDSLRQREETAKKQAEIQKLDEEVTELKQKNEEERNSIQDLELVLIKKRRRAEKCRRLAEAQSSYKGMLEKMIRDAMHQSVIYKEQARLNQAASNSLMARLEAQKAMCDSSERELHKKFQHRDELEKQARPEWEQQVRKRSRMDGILCNENDDKIVLYQQPETNPDNEVKEPNFEEEKDEKTVLCLPGVNSEHKQLRVFLEEEHKAFEAEIEEEDETANAIENGNKFQNMQIEENGVTYDIRFPVDDDLVEEEEDEESRQQRGKGNIEKWLQMLGGEEGMDQSTQLYDASGNKTDEIIRKMNLKYPQKEVLNNEEPEIVEMKSPEQTVVKSPPYKITARRSSVSEVECDKSVKSRRMSLNYPQKGILKNKEPEIVEIKSPKESSLKNPPYKIINSRRSSVSEAACDKSVKSGSGSSRRMSFDVKERSEKLGKFKEIARSESARVLRRIPSSPSIILGMKKGVDCIRRKPKVVSDDDDENTAPNNSFIKSSYKVIKSSLKI
ncbi:hypothetical protein CTI12_AA230870 [Artemisia annua]|nr:hypothetical protein CTI12_AA230870 [Artemisia annua]